MKIQFFTENKDWYKEAFAEGKKCQSFDEDVKQKETQPKEEPQRNNENEFKLLTINQLAAVKRWTIL